MCLAIPGRVCSIQQDPINPTALIDFNGLQKEVSILMVPEVAVDDYVLVHVGFAIAIIDTEMALQTIRDIKSYHDSL